MTRTVAARHGTALHVSSKCERAHVTFTHAHKHAHALRGMQNIWQHKATRLNCTSTATNKVSRKLWARSTSSRSDHFIEFVQKTSRDKNLIWHLWSHFNPQFWQWRTAIHYGMVTVRCFGERANTSQNRGDMNTDYRSSSPRFRSTQARFQRYT